MVHSVLVGGDWNMMFFLHRLGIVIIPIDELIFSEGLEPPTRVEFDEFNVGSPPLKEYIM